MLVVRAIRSNKWIGIQVGKVYNATVFKGSYGERIMVHTDRNAVIFNKDHFEVISE